MMALNQIARAIANKEVNEFLLGVALALRHDLDREPGAKSLQCPLPESLFRQKLPPDVRSAWVFVLRRGTEFRPERHPNSVQRMFALDGPGAMEVWEDGAWHLRPLDVERPRCGLTVPQMVWHRPVVNDDHWAVVSFHTVPATELIEELGDPERGAIESSRYYECNPAKP